MKLRHDVDATTIRPKVRKVIAAAVIVAAVTGSASVAAAPAAGAKVRHDCCFQK